MEKFQRLDIAMFIPGMNLTWESLEKDSIGGCITGDTFIDISRDLKKFPDGIPIKTLCDNFSTEEFNNMVYAYDNIQKRIVLRKILKIWKTKGNTEIWELIYQWKTKSGENRTGILKATPDHKIM